jgi:hypothetical protein
MNTSDRLLKGFKIYLVLVSCLMVAQFFYYELQLIFWMERQRVAENQLSALCPQNF